MKTKTYISTPEIRTKIAKENIKEIEKKIFDNLLKEREILKEREGLFQDIERYKLWIVEDLK